MQASHGRESYESKYNLNGICFHDFVGRNCSALDVRAFVPNDENDYVKCKFCKQTHTHSLSQCQGLCFNIEER